MSNFAAPCWLRRCSCCSTAISRTAAPPLRSCINATIGFEKLGTALGRSPKSLMRMFGPSGNPAAGNLMNVIGLLQTETGVRLEVRMVANDA